MSFRQVIDGPAGEQYVVTADRALARLLSGTEFTADRRDEDSWEVRIVSPEGEKVFVAENGEVAERLMLLLGEELELGVLRL